MREIVRVGSIHIFPANKGMIRLTSQPSTKELLLLILLLLPFQINRCDKMICEMSDKLRASLKEVYKISDPWEGMGDAFLPTGKRVT